MTADFSDITMIDLDTVDVSNLNRQFLFHKIHVGKSKSQAARESLLQMRPEARLVALHDSIMRVVGGREGGTASQQNGCLKKR